MASVTRKSPFVTKPTEQLLEAAKGTSLERGIGALDLTALGGDGGREPTSTSMA